MPGSCKSVKSTRPTMPTDPRLIAKRYSSVISYLSAVGHLYAAVWSTVHVVQHVWTLHLPSKADISQSAVPSTTAVPEVLQVYRHRSGQELCRMRYTPHDQKYPVVEARGIPRGAEARST